MIFFYYLILMVEILDIPFEEKLMQLAFLLSYLENEYLTLYFTSLSSLHV